LKNFQILQRYIRFFAAKRQKQLLLFGFYRSNPFLEQAKADN
jgi:hypothetical protein